MNTNLRAYRTPGSVSVAPANLQTKMVETQERGSARMEMVMERLVERLMAVMESMISRLENMFPNPNDLKKKFDNAVMIILFAYVLILIPTWITALK